VLCDGDFLLPEDFPHISMTLPEFQGQAETELAGAAHADTPQISAIPAQGVGFDGEPESGSTIAIFDPGGHLRTLEQIERDLIEYAIDLYAGHMTEIARRLGIGRSTLYRKLKEYDLEEHIVRAAG
jgi:DNA-binding NtrC family response regulator